MIRLSKVYFEIPRYAVTEFSDDKIVDIKRSSSKRISRCDVHPAGSMLNPVSFAEISLGSAEIFIEFSDQLYRLSRTRLGKLILTKATNPFENRSGDS